MDTEVLEAEINNVYDIIDDVEPICEERIDDEYCIDMLNKLINIMKNIRQDLMIVVEEANA